MSSAPGERTGAGPRQDGPVPGLPALWRGSRRRHLTLLVAAGLGQAGCAGVGAHFLLRSFRSTHTHGAQALLLTGLVLAAGVVGLLRASERVLTERLSQDYVHEIRIGLLRRNLHEGRVSSLGVAVTRTSNDLTSVKNWVSMGIAPLAVGVPLVLGALVVLLTLDLWLAIGFLVPLTLLGIALWALTPRTYARTRTLRAARGRLSGQIADTLLATTAVRSGGGVVRELNRLERRSRAMVDAAIVRSKYAGALRGAAAAATGLATAGIVAAGMLRGLPLSTVTAALTIVGFLATPVQDLGRVTEYRQNYRAARRIIGPAILADTPDTPGTPGAKAGVPAPTADASPAEPPPEGVLQARGVTSAGDRLPDLLAGPGDRVVLDLGDKNLETAVLDRFAGLADLDPGSILLGRTDLGTASHGRLRRLVGYAAQGMQLGRASITSTVMYRSPTGDPSAAAALLERVGLADRVGGLDKGAATVLRQGGQPLNIAERARLQVARALLNEPPLLVFDHLDADLGAEGRELVREALTNYEGIVLMATDHPEALMDPTLVWTPHEVRRGARFGRRAAS